MLRDRWQKLCAEHPNSRRFLLSTSASGSDSTLQCACQKKSPGCGCSPAIVKATLSRRLEPVVQAGPHDIRVELGIRSEYGPAASEIDVEIFDLRRQPADRKRGFDAAAQCPACFRRIAAADARN